MKDNFDLREFLVENKLTETSRAERQHFGKTPLNDNVLLECNIPVEECDMVDNSDIIDEGANYDEQEIRRNFANFQGKFGLKRALSLIKQIYPELKDAQINKYLKDLISNGKQAIASEKRKLDPEYHSKSGLYEASYFGDEDDEDNWADPDGDLDFTAGDAFANAVGGNNPKARKAAEKGMDFDTDEPDETYDEPDMEDDEFEDPESMNTGDVDNKADLASTINYDEDTTDLMMDDQELNDYLNSFNRPEVAAKTLQRALSAAQSEVDDAPGLRKLYVVLKNGFYRTDNFRPSAGQGKLIAVVRRHA